MIEPTAEKLNAYEDAAEVVAGQRVRCYAAGLSAVFAIIERDQAAELADLRALFELQRRRMEAATALWRAEDPEGRANVLPDLGNLLSWLMGRCMEPKGHAFHPLAAPARPGVAVCGAAGPDGVTCERQPHSWIRGSLHARVDEGNGLVQW